MKHPSAEIWMSHLYGELTSAEHQECAAHLAACPECRQAVEGWRATMADLDTDQATLVLPPRTARTGAPWQPALRWALAASVTLSAGFLAGRLSGPSREEIRQEVAAARQQLANELRARYQADLKTLADTSVASSTAETKRFIEEYTHQINTVRNDERRDFLKTMQAYEDRHVMDYAELRLALGQLAQRTGNGFRQTESQLNQLAGSLPPEYPSYKSNPDRPAFNERTP
jgi:hypothetical protein